MTEQFFREPLLTIRFRLPGYYFDIETTGLDPRCSKLCTIQYQALSPKDGSPVGDLVILKEWKSSEKEMLLEFSSVFSPIWDFVPIGENLLFDFNFLNHKMKQHTGKEYGLQFFANKPFIDIKHILVVKNRGSFKGYNHCLGKTGGGSYVPTWYQNGDYDKIEDYIRKEAGCFVNAYMAIAKEIPKILLPFETQPL